MSLSFFSPFLFLLSPKHVLERRKTHMCFAKSFTGFCGEPQISFSYAIAQRIFVVVRVVWWCLKTPFCVFYVWLSPRKLLLGFESLTVWWRCWVPSSCTITSLVAEVLRGPSPILNISLALSSESLATFE